MLCPYYHGCQTKVSYLITRCNPPNNYKRCRQYEIYEEMNRRKRRLNGR
ncbi:hypothetical protein HQ529_03570 [Candidatus Woesearchaeota archaeon]|nr:hypothetical protein [Candidatus Woesearchaeota archaeon]